MLLFILLLTTAVCARDSDPNMSSSEWKAMIAQIGDGIDMNVKSIDASRTEDVPSTQPDVRFASPSGMCNVTVVVIGLKELVVSKEFLAVHSPVFAAKMNDFSDSVVFVDATYEEFISLLEVIFPGRAKIADDTVTGILKLGYRYQIERALELAESHLKVSSKFEPVAKLQLADQYGLFGLTAHCLQKFSSVYDLSTLQSTAEYATFSDSLKAAICDRFMELASTRSWYS